MSDSFNIHLPRADSEDQWLVMDQKGNFKKKQPIPDSELYDYLTSFSEEERKKLRIQKLQRVVFRYTGVTADQLVLTVDHPTTSE